MTRVGPLLWVALTGLFVLAAPGAAQTESVGCASQFPEASWSSISETPTLVVQTAGLPVGVAQRFKADASIVRRWHRTELGTVGRATVCLFGPTVGLDPDGIVPEFQRIHAAAFGPESLVVVEAGDVKRVQGAIAYGLTYVALWEVARDQGLAGYPQPLADAVGQWYQSRATGKQAQHRSIMLRANFLNDPSGTAPPQDWAGSDPQAAVLSWNPEFSESPIGDMVEFAVAERGFEILADPTTETWAAVEVEYRVGLQEELFGDVGGSFGWPWGLAMVVGILLLALTLSGFEWHRKRRLKQRRAVSEPPIAGLFEEHGVE